MKKKSDSYRWQPSLPSETAKIAVAILPFGSHPHFPTTKAVSSALESLTSVFGMGTGIASPLWPPDIHYLSCNVPCVFHARTDTLFRKRNIYSMETEINNMVKPHDLLVLLG